MSGKPCVRLKDKSCVRLILYICWRLTMSAPFVVTELDLGLFLNCVLNECQKMGVIRMFQKSGVTLPECSSDWNFQNVRGSSFPECISDKNVSEVWGSRFQNVHLIGIFRMS